MWGLRDTSGAWRYLPAAQNRVRYCPGKPVGQLAKSRLGKLGGNARWAFLCVVCIRSDVVHKAVRHQLVREAAYLAAEAPYQRSSGDRGERALADKRFERCRRAMECWTALRVRDKHTAAAALQRCDHSAEAGGYGCEWRLEQHPGSPAKA